MKEARPEPPKRKKSDDTGDPKALKKRVAGRKKVVAVSHPLVRVARAFLDTFVEGEEGQQAKQIRETFGGGERVSFKVSQISGVKVCGTSRPKSRPLQVFVDFLTKAGERIPELLNLVEDEGLNRPWAPFYEQCPICHPGEIGESVLLASNNALPTTLSADNYPSYVLKSESPRLEEDLEFLQEALDMEEVEFPDVTVQQVQNKTFPGITAFSFG